MSDVVLVAAITAFAGAVGSLIPLLTTRSTLKAQADREAAAFKRQDIAAKWDLLAKLYTEALEVLGRTARLSDTFFIPGQPPEGEAREALRLSQLPLLADHLAALDSVLSRIRLSPNYVRVRTHVEAEFGLHSEVTRTYSEWKLWQGWEPYWAPSGKVVPSQLHATILGLSQVLQQNLEDLEHASGHGAAPPGIAGLSQSDSPGEPTVRIESGILASSEGSQDPRPPS